MRRFYLTVKVLLVFVMSGTGRGYGMQAAFVIPPEGKSELLSGKLGFHAPTAMAFDSRNRPYLLNNRNPEDHGVLRTIRDGKWVSLPIDAMGKNANRGRERKLLAPGEMVIDDEDCIYATIDRRLIYSSDLGKSFRSYRIKGSLEVRTGSQPFLLPPAICQITDKVYLDRGGEKRSHMAWWARRGTLSVILPRKKRNGLDLGKPIVISKNCLTAGSGGHSGGTSFAVTIGRYTHVVYAEVSKSVRTKGNPIHIATIDRQTRRVVAKEFLVTASPKKADTHTRPTITADGDGYLHVLSGSHGEPFFYLRSRKPNDISSGWTQPVEMAGRQCYASIVCDERNRLYSVYREWLPHASLGYSWTNAKGAKGRKWSKRKTVVLGANPKGKSHYGVFYHRLFIDRASTLYLSFTFYEKSTGEKGRYPEVLVVSEDGGRSWQLADRERFIAKQRARESGKPSKR